MPLVRSDIPKLLTSGLKKEFMKAYKEYPVDYPAVAQQISSSKNQETYAWLGSVPSIEEWKDEIGLEGMLEHNFSITNKRWGKGIAVSREALEDEQYGQISIRVKSLAQEGKRFFDELVWTLISQGNQTSGLSDTSDGRYKKYLDGKTISCYDSKAFFASDHSEGDSGTQSNLGSSELSSSALRTAITAMRKFKDDQGKYLNINPNLLIVPPDLQWEAEELLKSTYYPEEGSTTAKLAANVLKGKLDLLVTPYLSDSNDWFLFDTRGIVKPVILQMRRPPEFNEVISSRDYHLRGMIYYTVNWRGMVGFGDWRYGYGSFVT